MGANKSGEKRQTNILYFFGSNFSNMQCKASLEAAQKYFDFF